MVLLQMLDHLEFLLGSVRAMAAPERLLLGMGQVVMSKTCRPSESLLAQSTSIWTTVAVLLLVGLQYETSLEGFAAQETHMRPFACVRSAVLSQVHALDEPLSAHLAPKGPFTGVCAQVLAKVCVLTEALPAHLTRERPLTGVDSLVKCDSGGRHKQFAADRTLVSFGSLAGGAPRPPKAQGEVAQSVKS